MTQPSSLSSSHKPTLRVAELADSAWFYYNRGVHEYNVKNYKAALADYTTAIKMNPNFVYAYNNRGLVYHNLGNNQAALSDLNHAIKLKPDHANSYYNRGIVNRDLGNDSAALSDFEKARDLYRLQKNTKLYNESLTRIRELR